MPDAIAINGIINISTGVFFFNNNLRIKATDITAIYIVKGSPILKVSA